MKIAIVAAGAAGMYCGSCLRDNALARAIKDLGHHVSFIPTYTPLRLDEPSIEQEPMFLNGVQVYVEEVVPSARRPGGFLRRLLGSRAVLKWVARLAVDNQPRKLGRLTVSMLEGVDGTHRTSFLELLGWLKEHVKADVVHLSNTLLGGLAPAIKEMGVPVACGLSGEDMFLEGLAEPYRARALELIAHTSAAIDRFIAPSRFYAGRMAERCGLEPEKMRVVLPGISLADYDGSDPRPDGGGRRTIGYLARIIPEKGVHVLVEAFRRLAASGEFPDVDLKIAGYLGGDGFQYAALLRRRLAAAGLSRRVEVLGTLDRPQKIAFLRALDVFALPSVVPESKGLPVLEALASGVPVVVSSQGSLPELVEATGGGLVHESGDPESLANRLAELLRDDAQRRAMGESGRRAVHERFSAARMAHETTAVYTELLGER